MSTHFLNTIVLILIFIIIVIGGVYFTHQKYGEKINNLEKQISNKKSQYQQLKDFREEVEKENKKLENIKYQLNNFPTMLINKKYIHQVLLYFEKFDSKGEFFEFDYKMNNINKKNETTECLYTLSGKGTFTKIENFINYLEYSPPLFFIETFSYTFNKNQEGTIKLLIKGIFIEKEKSNGRDIFSINPRKNYGNTYNPFNPLIKWNLPSNEKGLIDIRNARLVSLLKPNTAWVKLSNGQLKQIEVGDDVYLGEMVAVNMEEGSATFNLNMGGIRKTLVKTLNEKVANVE
ncbi:MAG: hypothetical protein K9M80_01205 [Candidatus Marinimicrobia bacterium]|nr:hypothetical protein [Candidatus Neomarinimicrobiota bacterium]